MNLTITITSDVANLLNILGIFIINKSYVFTTPREREDNVTTTHVFYIHINNVTTHKETTVIGKYVAVCTK